MEYSIKQQLPYIIALTLLTLVYQYEINGYLIWWQALLSLPLIALSLWAISKILPRNNEFSIKAALKRYVLLVMMLTGANAYTFYMAHRYISLSNIAISIVSIVLMFVIMERSLYE